MIAYLDAFHYFPSEAWSDFGDYTELHKGAKSDVYYQDLSQKIKLGSLSHVIVGVRGLYHFPLLEQLDTYGGTMLGYNAITATGYDNSTGKSSGLTYTVLAGARYPFTKAIGAFLELGYGVAAINVGLSIKVK